MAKRRGTLNTDSSGQYFRQLGWKADTTSQPKFRLGRDRAAAELAYHRLGALWEVVVAAHQPRRTVPHGTYAPPGLAETQDDRPVWTPEALIIAEAIRKHQYTLRVGTSDSFHGGGAYVTYLDHLRQRFGHLIAIVPADEPLAEQGRQLHREGAQHRARQAKLNARIAQVPSPAGLVGASLHQALEAYAKRVEEQSSKESAKVEAANARRLKQSLADLDLAEFGYSAMERLAAYWASRPEAKLRGGKSTGRPISVTSVDNHVSTARRFVRWLDRTDAFDWQLPRHGLDALKLNLRKLYTDQEIADRRHGVAVFTVEQLAIIYRHATPRERLFFLLGLNAGMAQEEMISLRWADVEEDPPAIKRIRQKSGVYGEFTLWPQTWEALRQHRLKHKPFKSLPGNPPGAGAGAGERVLLTATGRPYIRQRISNAWTCLRGRIERETGSPADWWLPFKHLRKTGAQLVRNVSDGEIAGVYLLHGKAVATDGLADRYSNRPFHRVAEALEQVHHDLRPVWEA